MAAGTAGTIVLIHGLWMTPRSWEKWVPYLEEKGYKVLTPAYPGFEVEVEALREDPTPIATASVPETIKHLEDVIASCETPPILIGHSFGGALTQILLDRGNGACGIALNSAPPEGIRVNPISQIRSLFPILNNPLKARRTAGFTPKQFRYAFTNTLSEEESAAVYERYHIPAPGSWVWRYGLLANLLPGRQETWVNFKNGARPPLLFIAGGGDHIMPPSVNKSNAKKQRKSGAVTEYCEFRRRPHFMPGMDGWEAIADYGVSWAERQLALGEPESESVVTEMEMEVAEE